MNETTYKPKIEKYIEINWKKICTDIFPCFIISSCIIFFICFAIGNAMIFDGTNWKIKVIGIILSFPMVLIILAMIILLFGLICYGIFYAFKHAKEKWITVKEIETQIEISDNF